MEPFLRMIKDVLAWLSAALGGGSGSASAPTPRPPRLKTPQELAREIVAREGGFVNDPDDLGGATNYGVTIGTLRSIRPGSTVADLRALTREQAADIFVKFYFVRPRLNLLPECLHDTVFDMQVNAGNNAVKILQRLLNTINNAGLATDGSVGPKTVAAAAAAERRIGPIALRDAYGIARRNYYYDIADKRPANRKFARRKDGGKGGWITRAEQFISPQYHLTDAEHRARVAKWA